MAAQELANGISYSGHMYAMTRAGRHLTPAGDLQETFGGMEQVRVEKVQVHLTVSEWPEQSVSSEETEGGATADDLQGQKREAAA